MNLKVILSTLMISAVTFMSYGEEIVAFPGAQGWGRWAKGARASASPTVYHVTNLNDSGTGSLRDAVSQPNRIVVFDVSGVIRISSRMIFASNLYVAGQTAPGEGITVYGNGVSFSGSSNIICRYLRVRMGHVGDSGKDCAGIANGTNMIFDHCSFSWGLDETFSINPDGKGSIGYITLQNSIIGQGLMTHSAGGLMQADYITLYRNFYCDNSTRNNKVKGINQYANNIVYNWSNGAYIMGGDSEGKSYVNIESNLFINGHSTGASADAFTGANADFHCYGNDNWQDNNKDGVFNPFEITKYSAATRENTPYDYPELELYPGKELLTRNLPTVGASLPYRDQADCYMVDEVLSYGIGGALISNEESLPIGAPTSWAWWKGSTPVDSDGDGMPDEWEEANGTNVYKADATVKAENGYLNIENYINSIGVEDRQFFLRKPITLSSSKSTTSSITLSWRDYTYGEEGFVIEAAIEGSSDYQEVGKAAANATSCTISNLKDGSFYNVRVRAYAHRDGDLVYSEYATARLSTRPVEADLVDIDSYVADVTNSTAVEEGKALLWHTDDALSFQWEDVIRPSSVVVTGKGQITVSGPGVIGGEGTSLNKADAGTLIINNKNEYTGSTVLYDGVLEFNSIANGGVASAIGASQNFAQNWIFDGGTYRYTGGNASTDRNAQIKSASTLEVKNSTLTMNGTIEGNGDLTIDGTGTVAVPTVNFFGYTGTTTIKGGNLFLSTVDAAKNGIGKSSKLILAGGKLSTKGESNNYETYSFPIELVENTYSYFAPNRNCYFKSRLSGSGTLEYVIPYLREYFDADVAGFTGKIVANDNSVSGWFCPQKSFNMPTTQVLLKGKTIMCMWDTNGNGYVGGISGESGTRMTGSSKQSDGVTCNWTVGGANSDETFRGTIDNSSCASGHFNKAVNITKVGTGLWRLTGTNKYQGATVISAGTLIINGVHTGNCGYASAVASTYEVRKEAMLKGTGSISGKVTVNQDGILCPGDTLVNDSNLKIIGSVSFNAGSSLVIPIYSNGENVFRLNALTVEGTISVAQGAVLELDLSRAADHEFKEGDAIPVFRNSLIKSGIGSFDILPATPGEGLEWETSTLFVDGSLRVKKAGEEYHGEVLVTKEIQAQLEHTASVQGGENTPGKFLDLESHYYNNWGSVSWAAQAYTQFKLDIAQGAKVLSAEYSIVVNCAGSKDNRALDVCYMPAGTPRINTSGDIPDLCAKTGTSIVSFGDIRRSYATKKMSVTEAVKAMVDAGQDYIIFIHSNGAAGGQIYGKGSSANAPKLSIVVQYDANAIENLNEKQYRNHQVIDMTGSPVRRMESDRIYLVNGKKVIMN